MGRNLLMSAAAVGPHPHMAVLLSVSARKTPKRSAVKDLIAIPIHDPQTKATPGALFTPAGAGPFPAVIYMGTGRPLIPGRSRREDCPCATACSPEASRC